ncbi:diheme cytochrome c-553 [Luteolibacter luteus]|uniref:Diheme cytochrome c-553 n=1 Tax=Luteolibacter luteus TaxID=2728835 RepID=A0A858RQK3_9BACT|nr:diheme cytochrome c-553 [Luteolibacter luteus]QJE98911.1 diheme cytochrome c-553 [Luteolibacter luteus]
MKFPLTYASLGFLAIAAALLVVRPGSEGFRKPASHEEMMARGESLVRAGNCSDCHTPKIMTEMGLIEDKARLFAGHPAEEELEPGQLMANSQGPATAGKTAWEGPWGISYASNLTSDPATGMWSEDTFIKAMRTGKRRGHGREILPPMPWQQLAASPDEDLKAIYAYLSSLPPVYNNVPDPVPAPMTSATNTTAMETIAGRPAGRRY